MTKYKYLLNARQLEHKIDYKKSVSNEKKCVPSPKTCINMFKKIVRYLRFALVFVSKQNLNRFRVFISVRNDFPGGTVIDRRRRSRHRQLGSIRNTLYWLGTTWAERDECPTLGPSTSRVYLLFFYRSFSLYYESSFASLNKIPQCYGSTLIPTAYQSFVLLCSASDYYFNTHWTLIILTRYDIVNSSNNNYVRTYVFICNVFIYF